MKNTSLQAPFPLSAKSALLFYAALLLVYFFAGTYLQTQLGLLGIFINQIFLLGVPVALLAHAARSDLAHWPSWRWPGLAPLLASAGVTLLLSFGIDLCIEFQDRHFPPPLFVEEFFRELTAIRSPQEAAVKVLVLAVAPAFCEEVFFRGLLLPAWAERFGWIPANILASLAFALAHGNLLYFHYYFILGFFMGGLMRWKQSLWLPILAHFTNNAWTLLSSNWIGKY